MTTSPGLRAGELGFDVVSKITRFIGISMTQGAIRPSHLSPPRRSACPNGRKEPCCSTECLLLSVRAGASSLLSCLFHR